MYTSLLLPWSSPHLASPSETLYRAVPHTVRTKGTIFLAPPPPSGLVASYTAPPRPQSRMSAGAVALCKHFERGGASSEHGRPHPYWALPRGSNEAKSRIALEMLERMMSEVVWRNVLVVHSGVVVYEVRNARGWGMRWTLGVEEEQEEGNEGERRDEGEDRSTIDVDATPGKEMGRRIVSTTFRGFVEPIEGLDHELGEV